MKNSKFSKSMWTT